MGLFRVLCCCFSSSRYDDSISDYVPYARSITATPDPVRDLSKNTVQETTRPVAKDLTPPPNYSAASLPLKKQTIAEAEAVPVQELSSAGEIKQRPIKELRQRKEHTSICHDYTPRTPQAGSSRENNSNNQPRYELQSPFQSQTVSPITPPRTNPLVLSTGTHRELPSNPAFPSSPSTTSTISGDYPLNNAPFSPVSPPSTTTTTIPASSPPAAPAPTQTPITPPPAQPGLHCPSCSSRNDIRSTGAGFNAGRTFRICSNKACGSWNGFTDAIGLTPGNYCDCGTPAEVRLVAMNRQDAQGRRQAFYSCQYKACNRWERCVDGNGEARWFSREEMDRMRREGRI